MVEQEYGRQLVERLLLVPLTPMQHVMNDAREGLLPVEEGVGDHHRNGAIAPLLEPEVPEPTGEKGGAVHVETRGRREDLNVAGPAEALVALGAVGGEFQEVAVLAPDDVVLELVDELVRAFEVAGRSHVGMDHDARQIVRREGAGVAVDGHVAEALEGEVRLVDLRPLPVQNEPVRLLRRP